MNRYYGHWILTILIVYVISVFYIISTLQLNVPHDRVTNYGDDIKDDSQQIFGEIKSKSRNSGSKQPINSVVVESAEDEMSNAAVGRNILIEKVNEEDKQPREEKFLPKKSSNNLGNRQTTVQNSFKPIGDQFYVYSAYLDNRLRDSFIRIVAIGPRRRPKHKSGLWCQFEVKSNSNVTTDIRLSETRENNEQLNSFYLMSCIVPTTVVKNFRRNSLSNVLLSTSKSAKYGLNLIVVNNTPYKQQNVTKPQFGICVPPLNGIIKALHFVEFVELSRLLGSDHIFIYSGKISEEISPIVKVYQSLGIVTVLSWNPPDKSHIWNNGQSAAIADCLYRNMFKYQALIFNDINEFIIPRNLESWSTMLAYLENQRRRDAKTVAAYRFESSFFNGNSENSTSEWRLFKSLNNILRTKDSSAVRTRLMVYPETVFELGIYHLSQPVKSHYKTIDVNFNTALVHHYGSCADVREVKCVNFTEDYTAQRYGTYLVDKTKLLLRRAKSES